MTMTQAQTSLRELVAKWRESAQVWADKDTNYGASVALTLEDCANELQAALDVSSAPGEVMFTPAQLEMFAHLATEKAQREAELCYPADDPRIERAAQELMVVYYRQYTTRTPQ